MRMPRSPMGLPEMLSARSRRLVLSSATKAATRPVSPRASLRAIWAAGQT